MTGSLAAIIGGVIGVLGIAAQLFFWYQGRKNEKARTQRKDNEVLRRQRDNDVYTVDDADAKWVYLRNKHRK